MRALWTMTGGSEVVVGVGVVEVEDEGRGP